MSVASNLYIYRDKNNWLENKMAVQHVDVANAFKAAREDFKDAMKERGVEKDQQKIIMNLINKRSFLDKEYSKLLDDLLKITQKEGAPYMQELKGLGMSLNNMAHDDKLKQRCREWLKSTEKATELLDGLNSVLTYLDDYYKKFIGKQGIKGTANGGLVIDDVEISPISQTKQYQRLKELVDKGASGIRLESPESVAKEIQNIAYSFYSGFNGAMYELLNRGLYKACLPVAQVLKELGMEDRPDAKIEVIEMGDKYYEGSYTNLEETGQLTTRNKADTLIRLSWGTGANSGYIDLALISEKRGEIKQQSNEVTTGFQARFAGEARYDIIFNNVEVSMQSLFCNMYIHESDILNAGDTPIMGYIGARCATNILAGIPGFGMATILHEGTGELMTVEDFLNKIIDLAKTQNLYKYMSVRIVPQEKQAEIASDNAVNRETKEERSNEIYTLIKDSINFSATLGSRAGF